MHNRVNQLYHKLMEGFGVPGLSIPFTAVKLFREKDVVPELVLENEPEGVSCTICQGVRQASLGDAVYLTRCSIGCIAAAISLGLVDENQTEPLQGPRVYTDLMKKQDGPGKNFSPPSPKDFTEGTVYACKEANRPDLCLFGPEDSGRFKDRATARKAIAQMTAIQPPMMKGIFLSSHEFPDLDIVPDSIIMSLRPVELTRFIQAYQYYTGERVTGTTGAVRVVCSDLIARVYITGEINVSTYCLGARLIAQYEADRIGMAIPFDTCELLVDWLVESKEGYPFHLYPGAAG